MFKVVVLTLGFMAMAVTVGAAERVTLTDKQLDRITAGDSMGSMLVNGVLVSWNLTGTTTSVTFGADGSVSVSASTP
jgi:hypothetical protein